MLAVMPRHSIAGIAIGIDLRELRLLFADNPDLERLFGTPYLACFQWAIQTFLDKLARYPGGEMPVAFFHENNDFQAEAQKAFRYIELMRGNGRPPISLTFVSKSAFTPLQSADILAYEANHAIRNPGLPPRKPWRAINPKGNRIDLLHYGKSNMGELVRLLNRAKEIAAANGWDGKSFS